MLRLLNLQKRFGDRTLFEGVNLTLDGGRRYALVGANGSGKSTLLRILMGHDEASDGNVERPRDARVGFMRQVEGMDPATPAVEMAMAGDVPGFEALMRQRALLAAPSPDAAALAQAEEDIGRTGAYGLHARASEILAGLGLDQAQIEGPYRALSGGYRARVLLGEALVADPDVLLLDEPTNHLDISSIGWLEDYLQKCRSTVVVVSHDHIFLQRVATDVLDVDYERVTHYAGGYDRFLPEKELRHAQHEAAIKKKKAEIEKHEAFITRFKAKATKARQAQSRVKQMERIVIEPLPETSRRAPHFRFPFEQATGKEVLTVEGLKKTYGPHRVLDGVDLLVRKGERVALVGKNGIGKSTLLDIAVGERDADGGSIQWGHNVTVGYFPQDHGPVRNGDGTVLSFMTGAFPAEPERVLRSALAQMLFDDEDVKKPLGALSGGEAARLLFTKLTLLHPNVLVLDEPTNHLDLESIEALSEALAKYPGTLLFVTHDRWLTERVATRVLEVSLHEVSEYKGALLRRAAELGDDTAAPEDKGPGDAALHREKRKEQERARRKIQRELDDVTAAIERAETDIAAAEAKSADPAFFTDTPPDAQKAHFAALDEQRAALEQHLASWESLAEQLEAVDEG